MCFSLESAEASQLEVPATEGKGCAAPVVEVWNDFGASGQHDYFVLFFKSVWVFCLLIYLEGIRPHPWN